jgi:hypothetical protein
MTGTGVTNERKDPISEREEFWERRDQLNIEIRRNRALILESRKKVNSLLEEIEGYENQIAMSEQEISFTRPVTEKGLEICTDCDFISMAHIGDRRNGAREYFKVYECEVCGGRVKRDYSPFVSRTKS